MGEEIAARWIEQAKRDLDAARDSLEDEYFAQACFQTQQAAQKALKGYLLGAGRPQPFTNSIEELIAECEGLDPGFQELRRASELDQQYTRTTPASYFDAEDAERCLSLASSVIVFVTKSSES